MAVYLVLGGGILCLAIEVARGFLAERRLRAHPVLAPRRSLRILRFPSTDRALQGNADRTSALARRER